MLLNYFLFWQLNKNLLHWGKWCRSPWFSLRHPWVCKIKKKKFIFKSVVVIYFSAFFITSSFHDQKHPLCFRHIIVYQRFFGHWLAVVHTPKGRTWAVLWCLVHCCWPCALPGTPHRESQRGQTSLCIHCQEGRRGVKAEASSWHSVPSC